MWIEAKLLKQNIMKIKCIHDSKVMKRNLFAPAFYQIILKLQPNLQDAFSLPLW